jgi:hypothetical protein
MTSRQTYARCKDCGEHEVGLSPVFEGRRRIYVCGSCWQAREELVLAPGPVILGPVVAQETFEALSAEIEARMVPRRPVGARVRSEAVPGTLWDDLKEDV